MKENYEDLLTLTRLGIGHSNLFNLKTINWEIVQRRANEHGLSAIILDGIDKIPIDAKPKQKVLLNWIEEVLHSYEQRSEQYQRAVSELAGWYNSHGFKMMVLKGYACSLDWPRPGHRPCGDIDIWLFGQQKNADILLAKEKNIKIDGSHHHHTVFNWHGFTVENHYDFINIHHHKSNVEFEKLLKELAKDDNHFVEVLGEMVYLPSPQFTCFIPTETRHDSFCCRRNYPNATFRLGLVC